MENSHLILAWVLFGGTHIGMSSEPFRTKMVEKFGEMGFRGMYSLVSLATFGFLIFVFSELHRTGDPVITYGELYGVFVRDAEILMGVAMVMLALGFVSPSAMGMLKVKVEPYGINRITRHPVNMAFALFGIAHIVTNPFPEDIIFFGGFVVFGYFASVHQDKRKLATGGPEIKKYIESTSIIPFVAIFTGKQTFRIREINILGVVIGAAAALLLRLLHPTMQGVFS